MSLAWFPFYADAYTGDTAHLTTLDHGAYLMLMLAYYRSEKPLPASDRALAAITKLSIAEWLDVKPSLAPFFTEADGQWTHARIEHEIAESTRKRKVGQERASAAAKAKHAQRRTRAAQIPASSMPQADVIPAQSMLQAGVEQSSSTACALLNPAQLQLQSNSLSHARAREESIGEFQERNPDDPPAPPDEDRADDTPIDPNFTLPIETVNACMAQGATAETVAAELAKFIFHHRDRGTWSHDWLATWGGWWMRWLEYRDKELVKAARAARRRPLEVEPEPAPPVDHPDGAPTAAGWGWWLKRWKSDQSTWSHKTCGAAPGQAGCRVPAKVLIDHGIDPKTGGNLA